MNSQNDSKEHRRNLRKAKSNERVFQHDVIFVLESLETHFAGISKKPQTVFNLSNPEIDLIENMIVDKQSDFLILNKPPGLISQGANSQDVRSSLPIFLRSYFEYYKMVREVYIVHRLDKVAEGLLVVATSRKFAREIGEMIKRSQLKKSYLVSVQGRIQMLLNPDYFLKIEYVSDLFFSFEQNGGFKGNGDGQKKKKQNTEGWSSARFYVGFVIIIRIFI